MSTLALDSITVKPFFDNLNNDNIQDYKHTNKEETWDVRGKDLTYISSIFSRITCSTIQFNPEIQP